MKQNQDLQTPKDTPLQTFEEKMEQLETITNTLRNGDIPLKDAANAFETGILLAHQLETELSAVEQRIEILVNNPPLPSDTSHISNDAPIHNVHNEEVNNSAPSPSSDYSEQQTHDTDTIHTHTTHDSDIITDNTSNNNDTTDNNDSLKFDLFA